MDVNMETIGRDFAAETLGRLIMDVIVIIWKLLDTGYLVVHPTYKVASCTPASGID